MKREEAINVIKENIKNSQSFCMSDGELADLILDALEYIGMTPPKIMKEYAGGQEFGVHEWESETDDEAVASLEAENET